MHVFLAPVSFEEKYSSFDDLVVYDKIALTRAFKLIYLLSKIFNLFPALRSINSSHSRCACSFLKQSSTKGNHLQTYRKFNLADEVGQLHKMLIFFILKLLNTFPDA